MCSAPAGNGNALKTATYSHALALGKMPPKFSYIRKLLASLKQQIEAAVLDARDEIDLVDAATIQTILRAERHARLCERLLVTEADMDVDQRTNLSREAHRASEARDKALRSLDLRIDKTDKVRIVVLSADPRAVLDVK
jgi:hypothetical protein